jgi:Tfp pilus assembly protein PilF
MHVESLQKMCEASGDRLSSLALYVMRVLAMNAIVNSQNDDKQTCTFCGQQLPQQARFCSNCGSVLPSTPTRINPPFASELRSQEISSVHIFFSYARQDQALRDKLEDHLSNLKYRGLITTWHAREISAGEEHLQQIEIHLNGAHLILLLISASFMASEYCYSQEMKRALERHARGEARVVPILLRPVLFSDAPFARLELLPANKKPVTSWRDRERAFVDIALAIERLVLSLQPKQRTEQPTGLAPTVSPGYLPYETPTQGSAPAPYYDPYGSYPQVQPSAPVIPHRAASSAIRVALYVFLCLVCIIGLFGAGLFLSQHLNVLLFLLAGMICLLVVLGVVMAIRKRKEEARKRAEAARVLEEYRRREEDRKREKEARRRAEEVRKQEEETRRQEQEALREEARVHAYYSNALKAYQAALESNNADATAYRGKGNALAGLGRYEEALQAFEQANILAPQAITSMDIGNVLVKLGRYGQVVAAYKKALELDTQFALDYQEMSETLKQLGGDQEAQRIVEYAKQLGYKE